MSVEKQRLYGLQAGRGIAAMLVVLHHAANHLKQEIGYLPMEGIFHFGRAGVDFFFVLSGFIIFHVHAKDVGHASRLNSYVIKRFTRIFPIYWIALAISLAVILVAHKSYPALDLLKDAALLPSAGLKGVGVAWTLRYELFFYTVFAVAILSLRVGTALLVIWLAFIANKALNIMPLPNSLWLNLISSAWNIEFLLGMFSAYYLAHHRITWPKLLLVASIIGFLITGCFENKDILDGSKDVARVPYGVMSMFIVMGLVECERSQGLKTPSFLVFLGETSYSIYLMHLLSFGIAYKILNAVGALTLLPVWLTYLILFAAGVAGGAIVSVFAERPSMRLTRSALLQLKFHLTGGEEAKR